VARYKVLKSVAHNFAHSFVSDVAWTEGDYPMGHLLRSAREIGEPKLSVDLVTGEVAPEGFVGTPGGKFLEGSPRMFTPSWLSANQTSVEFVTSARMDVVFDLSDTSERVTPWRVSGGGA
jgi:hypothetical protein